MHAKELNYALWSLFNSPEIPKREKKAPVRSNEALESLFDYLKTYEPPKPPKKRGRPKDCTHHKLLLALWEHRGEWISTEDLASLVNLNKSNVSVCISNKRKESPEMDFDTRVSSRIIRAKGVFVGKDVTKKQYIKEFRINKRGIRKVKEILNGTKDPK